MTGASGFTGGRLCEYLLGHGHEVRALVRPTSDTSRLEPLDVEIVHGDLARDEPLDPAVQGTDVVFHVAALFRDENTPKSAFWRTNVDGTRRLLDAAVRYDVTRVVHTSTVGVQGHIDLGPADETYRYAPGDHYQTSKLDGERIALDFAARGLPVTVVRPAGIYGPGDLRFLKLFRFINSGRFRMLGSGRVRYHFTHVDDLVRGMTIAATHPQAAGEVFTLAGPDAPTLNELVELIAGILGRPNPADRFHLPVWPVYAAGALCEWICRPLRLSPPLYRRRVEFFVKNRYFDVSKARRLLGFQGEMSIEQGLRRTAEWYRSEGLLD